VFNVHFLRIFIVDANNKTKEHFCQNIFIALNIKMQIDV